MSRDKQISEMAKAIEQARIKATDTTNSMNYGFGGWYAKELYNEGYRKIYDDNQRQCTCYALGCQMAEELKKKVAREIFEEIEEGIKAAVSALQYENNPIHRQVKHETYSSVMRFIKTVEQKYTEEGK